MIIGEDEVAAGVVQVKELRQAAQAEGSGQQAQVPAESLVDYLIDAMVGASE